MTIAGCNCAGRPGNSGTPNVRPFGVTSGLYMVPLNADDGTRNGLDLTSTTLGADLLALVNHVDPSKRWYPYQGLRNVTQAQADATYETFDNGERTKLRDGVKNIMFEVTGVTEQYFNATASACTDFGLVLIDVCNNIKGQLEGDTLYPRPVNTGSFDSMYIDAVADASPKVRFTMDYDILTSDGDQWQVLASDFAPIQPNALRGLIDATLTLVDVVSATEFIADAELNYGPANNPLPFKGGVAANFGLYNVTDSAAITPTTVVESTTVRGRYTFTVPAVTASDEVTVDLFKAATGNNMNGYESNTLEFVYSWT